MTRVFYTTILALLVLLTAPAMVAFAGFFTYYPVSLQASYVAPPVTLYGLESDYTSVLLGPAAASAEVTVNITTSYIITLVERAALYWSDFSYDPIARGEIIPLSGNWSWDGDTLVVTLDTTPQEYGGEAIALINVSLPGQGTVYVNYDFMIVTSTAGYADIVLYRDAQAFYTAGAAYNITTRWGFRADGVAIYEYTGAWTTLYSRIFIFSDLLSGVWYDATVEYNTTSSYIAIYSGTTLLGSATGSLTGIRYAGFGAYVEDPPFTVRFDEVVITINKRPYTVNVTGLQPGWYVEIRDSSNRVLTSATAGLDGVAVLDFWYIEFARNATIVVYNGPGGAVIAAQRFDWIVGGDVYRLVDPLAEGFTVSLLGTYNGDDNYYDLWLVLNQFTVAKGVLYNLTVYTAQPGQQPTTPIMIVGANTVYDTTGPLGLPPAYTAYIYMYVLAANDTLVDLDLTLAYSNGGVTVYYPIRVTVHVYDPAPRIPPATATITPDENTIPEATAGPPTAYQRPR